MPFQNWEYKQMAVLHKILIYNLLSFGILFGICNLPYKDLVLFILRGAVLTRQLFSFLYTGCYLLER